jgi:hypothetical protein
MNDDDDDDNNNNNRYFGSCRLLNQAPIERQVTMIVVYHGISHRCNWRELNRCRRYAEEPQSHYHEL